MAANASRSSACSSRARRLFMCGLGTPSFYGPPSTTRLPACPPARPPARPPAWLCRRLIMEAGTKAFLSYVRAYKEHHCKFIFRMQVGGCTGVWGAFIIVVGRWTWLGWRILSHPSLCPHGSSTGHLMCAILQTDTQLSLRVLCVSLLCVLSFHFTGSGAGISGHIVCAAAPAPHARDQARRQRARGLHAVDSGSRHRSALRCAHLCCCRASCMRGNM